MYFYCIIIIIIIIIIISGAMPATLELLQYGLWIKYLQGVA